MEAARSLERLSENGVRLGQESGRGRGVVEDGLWVRSSQTRAVSRKPSVGYTKKESGLE